MHNIAVVLTYILTGTPYQLHLFQRGYLPRPTEEQVRLFTVISLSGLALVSVLGLVTLGRIWRGASQETADVPPARAGW